MKPSAEIILAAFQAVERAEAVLRCIDADMAERIEAAEVLRKAFGLKAWQLDANAQPAD